ncbi:hypothetical protein [Beggiatoa leptomitoformis]|uniref:HEAT repeat domain-containing protein n=1 Tax=Beggiatoa leptomitoformis TaxID=288004 RepID=A0A2N9YFM1_9GAMM|nr:hypothetical protein [Beggiatoa leptomitoformis]ALG68410.1 hypothetical protein AL038_12725 [Beggiatoa leptomitoformis]AUI69263.1 hypothetical protein BLE401_11540 [Beggiatoa leptomitoformis]
MTTTKQKKAKQTTFEIALLVNNEKVSLDYEMLERILGMVAYNVGAEWLPIMSLLAQHPNYQVRQAITSFPSLSQEMFNQLISDKNSSVIQELLRSELCEQFLTAEHIRQIIQRDETSLLIALINTLHTLQSSEEIDNIEWYEKLLTHSDPEVRKELAGTEYLTGAQITQLTEDKDPLVARTAKATLKNMDYDDCEDEDEDDDNEDN